MATVARRHMARDPGYTIQLGRRDMPSTTLAYSLAGNTAASSSGLKEGKG